MKLLKYVLAFLLVTGFSFSLQAQELNLDGRGCGISMKSEWLTRYQAGEITPVPKFNAFRYIPTRYVIVGADDGTGYVNHLSILNALDQLNEDFATANMQYYLTDIDYYNDSDLWEHATTSAGSNLASRQNKAGVLNIYFTERAGGACGYAIPETNFLVMQNSCSGNGDRTLSHEAGHVFTLPHTFYGWESVGQIENIELNERAPNSVRYRGRDVLVERADSSNCATAADGFCDTAPDYLMERWSCNGNTEYRDSLLDPDSVRIAVPGVNFMSYANDLCQATFTEEQMEAMQTNLMFRNDIRDNTDGSPAIAANGEDLSLILPEDGERTEWANYVELEWNSVPNADFYLVQLNVNRNFGGSVFRNFFTKDTTAILEEGLVANRRYYWRVRPINGYLPSSEFGEEIWEFRTGRNAVSSIDPTLAAAISLAPNPVFGGQDLRITGRDLGVSGKLTYQLIDPAGRVLLSRENLSVAAAAGFSERIETAGLPAGVYFLRLRLDDKLVTRRVMVTP